MTDSIQETYRIIGDLPRGDALKAQSAAAADGTEVVVKTVKPVAPDMFMEAVARLSAVAGPHDEHVLAWEAQGQFVLVATEAVNGSGLGEVLAGEGAPAPRTAASLGAQAALGLAGLHEHGIVHGGIKPSTLIRTPDGTIVLVDAGLAQAQGGADLTEEAPPGNAAYVSPEEVLGRPLVAASDVYSLGVVLYQLVAGRLPFDGQNALVVAQDHVGAAVTPPRQLNPAVPVSLEAVILRALAKAPEDRYASGRELCQALENELQTTQIAPPVTTVPPAPSRRKVWPWIVAGVAALAVVLAVLWATGVFAQKSAVPNVVGSTLTKASNTLEQAGFKLGSVGYQQGVGKPQGTILSQNPAAGSQAKKGAAINLVAVGTSVQPVPNVIGMTEAAAKAAITQAGLAVGVIARVYSDTVATGTVADQAPGSGIDAPAGSQVALTVSRGPTPAASPSATAVPDVSAQSQAQATSVLQSAGFTVAVDKVPDSTVPAGTVTAQSPSAGVLAQPGTTVTIVVSTGPPTASPIASPTP